ncbi:formate/nitrite transporter family protein [Haloarchaeobius sp. DFWS5]|uniref:formate/nitrite transporter family protein n=1 Tax=Haloarchaeobius sp. DFWS5 TaxID=3446114 RepID=UPI003EB78E05
MSEDLPGGQSYDSDEQKPSTTILAEQIEEGMNQLQRSVDGLFLSGLSAGLDIGFGPLLMVVLLTLVGDTWGEPATKLLLANAYTVGFVFVVLGRSELFTEHTTLAVLPVIDRRAGLSDLGRLWGVVYAANVVGGALFAGLAVAAAPAFGIAELAAFTEIAKPLVDHGFLELLVGAVLAGWLMGLLSWLVTAAQETTGRMLVVWIVTVTIGLAHLPHCIAGNVEVLAAVFAGGVEVAQYARYMAAATIGNVIGGTTFVALLKYGHTVRGAQ